MSFLDQFERQAKSLFVFARLSIKKRYNYLDVTVYDGTRSALALDDQTEIESFTVSRTAIDLVEKFEMTAVGSIGGVTSAQLYFHDVDNNRIIVYNTYVGTSNSFTAVVESSLYLSTSDLPWYQTPTDDTSAYIQWQGSIASVPSITRSVANNYSGFSPVEISPLEVQWQNADLYKYFREASFVNCLIDVWICYGDLEPENIQKVFTGKIRGFFFDDQLVSFQLADYSYLLDESYPRLTCDRISGQCDPKDIGRPIPLISGDVRWLRCTNNDFNNDTPTTAYNRIWTIHDSRLGHAQQGFTTVTVGSPSAGDYPITVSADDFAKMFSQSYVRRGFDGAWALLTIDSGIPYITPLDGHTPLAAQAYLIMPVINYFFQVPSVFGAVQQWNAYEAHLYADPSQDNETMFITLQSTFESGATGLGISAIDPNDFEVWVQVLGAGKTVQLDGDYLEEPAPSYVGALAWYLKNAVGLTDSQINADSFFAALAARPHDSVFIGDKNLGSFITPYRSTESESHREVVSSLLREIGAVGYFDNDGKFTIKARGVMGAADWVLTESEINTTSMKYDFIDADVKGFTADGNSPYISNKRTFIISKGPVVTSDRIDSSGQFAGNVASPYCLTLIDPRYESVFTYDLAHAEFGGFGASAAIDQRYFSSLFRMALYFGNREGRLTLKAYGEIVSALPGEIVEIQRDLLPGYEYVPGESRTQKFFILSAQRDGDSIELELEDQFSIEESGGF